MLKGFPRRQETQILAEELTCLFSLYPVSSPEALGKVLLAPEAQEEVREGSSVLRTGAGMAFPKPAQPPEPGSGAPS